MFSQNTKLSVLGLALSLSMVVSGCGPAFKSKNGKAPGSVLSRAKAAQNQDKKSLEDLAAEQIAQTNARLEREKQAATNSKDGFIAINGNQMANFFVEGVKLERAGEDLVFTSLLKEKSSDNKGSVVLQAKILMGEDKKSIAVDAAHISVKTLAGARSEVAPNPQEYSLITTWSEMGSEVAIRLQRNSKSDAYAAEFNFSIKISDDKDEAVLSGSSLSANNQIANYDEAVKGAVVDVETKENVEQAQEEAKKETANTDKSAQSNESASAATASASGADSKTSQSEAGTKDAQKANAAGATKAPPVASAKTTQSNSALKKGAANTVNKAPVAKAPAAAATGGNVERTKKVTELKAVVQQYREVNAQIKAIEMYEMGLKMADTVTAAKLSKQSKADLAKSKNDLNTKSKALTAQALKIDGEVKAIDKKIADAKVVSDAKAVLKEETKAATAPAKAVAPAKTAIAGQTKTVAETKK